MLAFQVRLFARNSYFTQLLVTSTVSILLLQYVASFGAGSVVTSQAWLRAGMTGTWTTCAVSTGLIGFQRFQGTLVHQVAARIGARPALVPVVGSAATFGLLAFPLAAAGGAILGIPLAITGTMIVGLVVFWFASLSTALLVAAAFAHSPNALVYESTVAAPIVLLSGMFGLPGALAPVEPVLRILPLRSAVQALSDGGGPAVFWLDTFLAVVVSVLWLVASAFVAKAALRRAVDHATLDIT
ncbi:hypothetical protein GCM10007967_05850 [Xylanimonas ulmi]